MNKSLTSITKPVATFSVLATVLSGCTYFTKTVDSQVNCPTNDLPQNHQPLDLSAQNNLQQLIRRAAGDQDSADDIVFVRLNAQGATLTAQQAQYDSAPQDKDYSTVPWSCVKDSRTGLTWEVKTNDQLLRDKYWTYTWLDTTRTDKDGKTGYAGEVNGGKCLTGSACDTRAYVTAINAKKLCGYNDWRLPRVDELHTLLNREDNCPGTCIDQDYFPNAARGGYWSSSPVKGFVCYAWGLDFELGNASGAYKNTPLFIRLVRGTSTPLSGHSENPGPQ